MLSQGCQKLDTFSETAQQQHRPSSDSSSDSSETMEKDRESSGKPKAGRHHEYDLLTQEDNGSDSSSEGQAEYDLVTPESTVPAPEDNTVYMQIVVNLQVSPLDQYTFPPPPLLEPSNNCDD